MNPYLAALVDGQVRCGPETLHVDLTNSCNLRCITCWDHSPHLRTPRAPEWKARRMSEEAALALVDDVAALGGLRHVILSGMGEPYTHPGAHRLVREIRARGAQVTVITNLLAVDMDELLRSPPDELLVGVQAASAEVYGRFHPGCPEGAWHDLLARLDDLRAAGRRSDKLVFVICEENARELPEMVRLAAERGQGRASFKLASLKGGTERCRLLEETRRELVERWIPEAARRRDVVHNLEVFSAQLRGDDELSTSQLLAEIGCHIGTSYARVLVDGTVLYCCSTEVRVGSLAQARFAELWTGPHWKELRARLRGGALFPACRQCGKLAQNIKLARKLAELRTGQA